MSDSIVTTKLWQVQLFINTQQIWNVFSGKDYKDDRKF